MTDIVVIATIVAFFAAAALLVRVIDRMITGGTIVLSDRRRPDLLPHAHPGPDRGARHRMRPMTHNGGQRP